MRTKGQQTINQDDPERPGAEPMFTQIKTAAQRSQSTFLADFTGAGALVVMLVVGLHLPGTF